MADGAVTYVTVEATSVVEAAETFACQRTDGEPYEGEMMTVIVLDPEADADDYNDDRYHIVDVRLSVKVTAHGTEVNRHA
jgi:hypothetical protein